MMAERLRKWLRTSPAQGDAAGWSQGKVVEQTDREASTNQAACDWPVGQQRIARRHGIESALHG